MNERKAVALEYSDEVPRILAIARGILFDKLIKIAKDNNITIYKDADLAETLAQMRTGDDIPPELFRAVVEVFAYCYDMNEEFKKKFDFRRNSESG